MFDFTSIADQLGTVKCIIHSYPNCLSINGSYIPTSHNCCELNNSCDMKTTYIYFIETPDQQPPQAERS